MEVWKEVFKILDIFDVFFICELFKRKRVFENVIFGRYFLEVVVDYLSRMMRNRKDSNDFVCFWFLLCQEENYQILIVREVQEKKGNKDNDY